MPSATRCFRILPILSVVALLALSARTASAKHPDIVGTAIEAGSFKTLIAAIDATDLVNALKGKGPCTDFAPTDEAFSKLPEGTLEELLRPEKKGTLAAILTYHVVPGRVTAKHVTKLENAKTLNGQRIDIAVKGGKVRIDGANVIKVDVETCNGVIHVIDNVIMPSTSDIVETAVKAGSFTTLATALKAASLVETLQGKGPFTVFAPTDDAFAKLPKGTVESLVKPENIDKLKAILTYHVVPGRIFSSDLADGSKAKTVQGGSLAVSVCCKSGVRVNDSKVVKADIDASNGVIHVIDTVLMPPAESTASTTGQGTRGEDALAN
jgi:uncharacterized surface protein with fasciclin (FAS1) repeats